MPSTLTIVNEAKPTPNIYVTDVLFTNDNTGITNFKLHVVNVAFQGFVCKNGRRINNVYNASISATHGSKLSIPNGTPGDELADVYNATAITLPIGVYDCYVQAEGSPLNPNVDNTFVEGSVAYGYTNNFHECLAFVETYVSRPPITAE